MTLTRTFAAALLGIACALPASAQFITTDRTIAGGNPLNGNYNGSNVFFGVDSSFNRVQNLRADVIDPAQFNYNDQTGGGLGIYSNSIVSVQGGTFGQNSSNGFGGGIAANDTSQVTISGGTIQKINLLGTGAGASGAQVTLTGGLVQNGLGGVAIIDNGILNVRGGTIRASGSNNQAGIVGGAGSVITISGGLVQSVSGTAVGIGPQSVLTITGGTITAANGGGIQRGVSISNATTAATLSGGTINGSLIAARNNAASPVVQATISGQAAINGGVFATGDAAIDILGGQFTPYANAAEFLTLGTNNINFYGSNLALSSATAGSIFDTNNIVGNFYTFTSGTLQDGQSLVGLRIFDATGTGTTGGFNLVNASAAAPEPSAFALLVLPALGVIARRRKNH